MKDVAETEAKRSPRAPFITSTLQQSASSRLGFAPSRTMGIAQRLYEAGLITYMRTDSVNMSQVALNQIYSLVEKKFGKRISDPSRLFQKSKNAQEAHEAIRPTNMLSESGGANDEQQKLYRLIWQRAVSSQMTDAKVMRTKITAVAGEGKTQDLHLSGKSKRTKIIAEIGKGEIPDFYINGSRLKFDGWLAADPMSRGEDVELPKVMVGEILKLLEMRSEGKQTEPPARYSEAGLVKELEKRGIGRPSTYASIIKTLEDRGYVEKINKALCPTDTGDVVSSFLEENFAHYISDSFTAQMEDKLDDIANGKIEYEKTLSDFYKPFPKMLNQKTKLKKLIISEKPTLL